MNEQFKDWLLELDRLRLRPVVSIVERDVLSWEEAEQRWVRYFRELGASLLNVTIGGRGHNGAPRTALTKALLRDANLGKSHGPETRLKMSRASKGKPKTEAHRAKMSAASKGKPKSAEHRANLAEATRRYWAARKAA